MKLNSNLLNRNTIILLNSITQIISTPLAAVISGGTYRSVSNLVDVCFDAGSSFDPDLDMDKQTQLSYLWGCKSLPTNSSKLPVSFVVCKLSQLYKDEF